MTRKILPSKSTSHIYPIAMLTFAEVETVSGQPVNLTPGLKRQFYPTLLLLRGLEVITTQQHKRRKHLDSTPDLTQTLEDEFQSFVCKLAFLCCTEPQSGSVSACTVLQLPDKIQYIFASNDRKPRQLEVVRCGVSAILNMLRGDIPSSLQDRAILHRRLLQAILKLSHLKLRSYLRGLIEQLKSCLEACKRESMTEGLTRFHTVDYLANDRKVIH